MDYIRITNEYKANKIQIHYFIFRRSNLYEFFWILQYSNAKAATKQSKAIGKISMLIEQK